MKRHIRNCFLSKSRPIMGAMVVGSSRLRAKCMSTPECRFRGLISIEEWYGRRQREYQEEPNFHNLTGFRLWSLPSGEDCDTDDPKSSITHACALALS